MLTPIQRVKSRVLFPLRVCLRNRRGITRLLTAQSSQSIAPIFIFGSGRNGSSLLSALLNSHPEIALPPEQYFTPFVVMDALLRPHLPWEFRVDWLCETLARPKASDGWPPPSPDLRGRLLGLPPTHDRLAQTLLSLYHYGAGDSAPITGDSTPLSTHYQGLILPLFPSARCIFLFRDPRDVAASYRRVEGHPARNLRVAIWKWVDSVTMMQRSLIHQPDLNAVALRYEDLVTDPAATIAALLSALNLSQHMLNHRHGASATGKTEQTHHDRLTTSINGNAIGRWKSSLTKSEAQQVETRCSSAARHLNALPVHWIGRTDQSHRTPRSFLW